ncbi:MAG: class I SAM-dependent methyltransferase [Lewinella sp.]|nr:class I SAM-dependent methyltransferase [Lewinella sp.]
MKNYLELNRLHWNQRTETHWTSDFYRVSDWLAGEYDSLCDIELALLPPHLGGLELLHLQCHFGQDTLSLARRGAVVTGVDLSDRAIDRARELAAAAGLAANFINCNLYDLPNRLPAEASFDLVFTTYGTIGWLPDLTAWAALIARYLKPGGRFIFAEFHPMVWMLNSAHDGFAYSYFQGEAIVEQSNQSYTGDPAPTTTTEVGWNHSLSAVLSALLAQGLRLEVFQEFDYSPWDCFAGTVQTGPRKFQLRGQEGILPLTYALRMAKESKASL